MQGQFSLSLQSTDVMVQRPLLLVVHRCYCANCTYLEFSSGMANFIPDVCQVVFANVCDEGRVVDPGVYGFFDGPGHILTLPCYEFEILQCCFVTSNGLMFKDG